MPHKKKSRRRLNVVFETSVLHTEVVHELVRAEVKHVIENNSKHPDLSIYWYIPETVIGERRYQMEQKAFGLLPWIEKVEKLLGHTMNITKDFLVLHVNEAIKKQLGELGVSTLDLDTSMIDWKGLINRAICRHPPFDPGKKEKGFRDSLIAEAFLQLVRQSHTTPAVCRLAIVTNDGLLADYVRESTKDLKNVRILSDVSKLESLINTLVSQVTEEFVTEVSKKASKYFFEEENESTLLYKEGVISKIKEIYGEELRRVPREGLIRENGTSRIHGPVFMKKERQRIFWVSPIKVDAELFKDEYTQPTVPQYTGALDLSGPSGLSGTPPTWPPAVALGGINVVTPPGLNAMFPLRQRKKVGTGQSTFEVHWSVNFTQARRFTSPSVDKIEFVSTKWDEE